MSRLHPSLELVAAGHITKPIHKIQIQCKQRSFCMFQERCHPKLSSRRMVFWCRTGGRRVSHAPSPRPGTRAADQAVLYRGWRDHCRTTATLQCVLPADVSAVSRACSPHWCWLLAWLETVSPGAAFHPSAEISSPVRTRSPHVATHVTRRLAKTICTH